MTEGVQVVESMLGREVLHRVYEETRNQESNFSYLELDEELGEHTGHCKHELLHKCSHDFI
jgi:hypothetical protein